MTSLSETGVYQFNLSEYGRLKVVGVTDEITTCLCCGKENLKRTAVMQDSNGNYSFFGTTCAYDASRGYATSVNRSKSIKLPVEVEIAGRLNRVHIDGQVEYFQPDSKQWKPISTKGLITLINDNLNSLYLIKNISKVIDILESNTNYRFPF